MIRAVFYTAGDQLRGFHIKGHAGLDEAGKDILCASVSSAVMTVVNGICECASVSNTELRVEKSGDLFFLLPEDAGSETALIFLQALELQLKLLQEDYKGHIKITYRDVTAL
ncbi:MAG: ribosomal-processing cysteine protease Prp [Oscillospiraceae bacterium]|nr:ribosomal-processing cysteine protease Prp [Oscillospiraceae bacterium]